MDIKKAQSVFRCVAEHNGVTEEVVVREIEIAIEQAHEIIYRRGNTDEIARWESIPCAGAIPSAYELLNYLCDWLDG